MAKAKAPEWPRTVSFGIGKVRIAKRGNGFFALSWREMGETRRTTKTDERKALEWASTKVRELDASTGNQWIPPVDGEALKALQALAGDEPGAARRLLDDVRDARRWLDGAADLTTAARWFAENGPMKIQRTSVVAAVARFMAQYLRGSKETYRSFSNELKGLSKVAGNDALLLLDLTEPVLTAWTTRKVNEGKDVPSENTVDNRMTIWITFLNRCRDWELLPKNAKHAGELLRRPVIPDAGKAIFSIDQGRTLLEAARRHDVEKWKPRPLRPGQQLEAYLLIGGWLGLRPTEIQRLTWAAFDFEAAHPYCHVTPEVAQKNSSERYIPIDPRLSARLKGLFEASGKKKSARCCAHRCREYLSLLAREKGVCEEWPVDVLRHSFCSYRIAVVKSLEQVATEADNSPAILKSNYRRPLRHEDGIAWWDLLDPILADLPSRISQAAG
ncbi:MAG: hypothetical protein ABIT37_01570 [Luteolibacter sp.]